MSATMTGRPLFQRFFGRRCFLRNARQCIILTHDADDRFARTKLCGKSSRQASYSAFYIKALGFGIIGKFLGRLIFFQCCLGISPDFIADKNQFGLMLIYGLHHVSLIWIDCRFLFL